jgi:signal transduction protein with GAF and PtsI domain
LALLPLAFLKWSMKLELDFDRRPHIDALHEIGERIAAADPLHTVLKLVVDFVSAVVKSDSCFVYVIDGNNLVLRASKNPHAEVLGRLKLRMGQGITGWVAEHKKPVAISSGASHDPRFQSIQDLPEDSFEAFLSVPILCRDKLVGVINLQHCEAYVYSRQEIRLISTVGFLVGPEIELARLEAESSRFSELAEARQLVETATGILQRSWQIGAEEASAALQRESRERRRSLKEIAEAVLIVDEMERGRNRAASG